MSTMKYVITDHGQVWRESKFRARFYESARHQDSKGGEGDVRLDRSDVPKRKASVHLLDHRIPYVPKVERNRYNHRPAAHR